MIKDLIRQMVQEELHKINYPWIAHASYIVLGKSPWRGDPSFLGKIFPVQVTGLTVSENSIIASVTLPKGPVSDLTRPYLTVAVNPMNDMPNMPPMWGDMQSLFLANLVATMIEESGVICLALSPSSRSQVIQAAINMGYDITF